MAYKMKKKKTKKIVEFDDEFYDETTGKKVGEGKSWEYK